MKGLISIAFAFSEIAIESINCYKLEQKSLGKLTNTQKDLMLPSLDLAEAMADIPMLTMF